IKVLDFGLAKLAEPAPEESAGDELAPTRSMSVDQAPRTEEGTIVGTVAYMSPEQAGGKKVDRRSDIFSFGSVLYEMATGSRPFRGDNKISTLAAILQQDPPPVSQVAPALPPELGRIIARCLRKDPERRFQHMDDVRVALQEMKEESESGRIAAPVAPRARVSAAPKLVALGLALAAILVAAGWWLSRPKPTPSLTGLVRLTSDSGLTWEPAFSPDGKLIAYSSDRGGPSGPGGNLDIWVQQVTGGEPIRLTRDPADDREPAFSSDGSRIAFRSDREGGGVYVMPALGGEARLVAKDGEGSHFSPDDQWIAYWVGHRGSGDPAAPGSSKSYVVASTGGPPRQILPEFSVARNPIWAPDGKNLLFWGKRDAAATGPESIDWWVAPLAGGPAVQTGAMAAFRHQSLSNYTVPAAWLPDGRVLFSAGLGDSRDLWQLDIQPGTWKAAGHPRRITTGTSLSDQPSVGVARDSGGRSVARLAFSGLTSNIQIWSLPLEANRGKVTGELQRLTQGPARAGFGSLSSDGNRLVFARARAGDSDIWMKDLPSGRETDLNPMPGDQFHPRISADGSKICYSETKNGTSSIYTLSIGSAPDGSVRPGVPQKLCDDCRFAWQWAHDGSRILLTPAGPGRTRIRLMNVATGEKVELLSHPQFNLYQANFSPDDRWVAFLANTQSQRSQLFIAPARPVPAPVSGDLAGDWIPVTSGGFRDDKPRWSPDGNLLYFISDRDGFLCFWAQRLDPAGKRPVGPPFSVYHFHGASRSIMNVGLAQLEPAVARDKMTFNLAEVTGNIWMASLEA
ncbi:MAG TPA: protein kinase, partial [Bryobacterales bacterium]|nr:protein kinase [Bryobacterales bacterium]